MTRIQPINLEQADPKARTLLEGVEKALGKAPNLMKTLAHSPATLQAYLGFGKAMGTGALEPALREQIAVAVSGINGCEYCASAHTAIGSQFGVEPDELAYNLAGESSDPKVKAALQFARLIVEKRGWVEDIDLTNIRNAGYTEGEIVEIIGTVALNLFSNYFNHITQPEIDFPKVEINRAAAA